MKNLEKTKKEVKLEGYCYFEDLRILGEPVPDIVICNECGFLGDNFKCKYRLCSKASPETCKNCGFLEWDKDTGIGICRVSTKSLLKNLPIVRIGRR